MKQILFFISLIIALNVSGQCVSIELSIRWKHTLPFEVEGIDTTTFRPAYLNVTYRNYCDYPVYFSKMADENQYFPDIFPRGIMVYKPKMYYKKYPEENYIVSFGCDQCFFPGWTIINEKRELDSYIYGIHKIPLSAG